MITLVLFIAVAVVLFPLVQRDCERAAARRRQHQFRVLIERFDRLAHETANFKPAAVKASHALDAMAVAVNEMARALKNRG